MSGPEDNGPNGYPIPGTNPGWDAAVKRWSEENKDAVDHVDEFLEKMNEALAKHRKGATFGNQRIEPPPPKRTVWADETQRKLEEIRKKRKELDDEERSVKLLCNHTYPNGQSAMTTEYHTDPYGPDSGPVTYCEVCNR